MRYNNIKYWFKVISTKDRKYVKQIYYIILDDSAPNPNVKTCASVVKTTLSTFGFYHVLASQRVSNAKNFLTIFKQRLPISVVVPYCYLFLLSVFILWFSYYVNDIFCKF